MANATVNRGLFQLANYNWDGDAVDLGVMLVDNTYVFSRAHNTIADVLAAGAEAAGAGYVRKSVAAALRTTNEDDVGNAANLRITNGSVIWVGINAGVDLRIILFLITGAGIADNTNQLLGYVDTGTNIPINTNGGDVTLNFHADGAFKFS